MAEKLITPEFRGSFVHLVRPQKMKGDDDSEPRYQMLCPFESDDPFLDELEDAVHDALKDKFGKVPSKFKHPLKDGDDEEYENLKGMMFFNATNNRRPGVVDADLNPIMDESDLYSGAWYRVSVSVYAWSHPTGGKGVSISLNNVMKIRDDERFDGGTTAEEDFAGFAQKPSGRRSKRDKGDDDDDDRPSRRRSRR